MKAGLPLRVFNPKTEDVDSVVSAHGLLMKVAAARGDHPWIVSQLREKNPTVAAGILMTEIGDKVCLIFLFSRNMHFTKYFSKVVMLPKEKSRERTEQLNSFFGKCGSYFRNKSLRGNEDAPFSSLVYLTDKTSDPSLKQEVCTSLAKFGAKTSIVMEASTLENIGVFPVSNPKMTDSKVSDHRAFSSFYNYHSRKFDFSPEFFSIELSPRNSAKFLV